MKLTDMKQAPCDSDCQPAYTQDSKEIYPWGLQISLNDDDLKKLGIESLPEMGAQMTLNAKVTVYRIRDEKTFHGYARDLGLQITEMALSTAAAAAAKTDDQT